MKLIVGILFLPSFILVDSYTKGCYEGQFPDIPESQDFLIGRGLTPDDACRQDGTSCNETTWGTCCSGNCQPIPGNEGSSICQKKDDCRKQGMPCGEDFQCCSYRCSSGGLCGCTSLNGKCRRSDDCCSGNSNMGGVCENQVCVSGMESHFVENMTVEEAKFELKLGCFIRAITSSFKIQIIPPKVKINDYDIIEKMCKCELSNKVCGLIPSECLMRAFEMSCQIFPPMCNPINLSKRLISCASEFISV